VTFDVPDFPVTAGDVLAIAMTTPEGAVFGQGYDTPFAWARDDPGGYAPGRTFVRGSDAAASTWGESNTNSAAVSDYEFRTFVDPVPEPRGVVAVCGAVWLVRRTRRGPGRRGHPRAGPALLCPARGAYPRSRGVRPRPVRSFRTCEAAGPGLAASAGRSIPRRAPHADRCLAINPPRDRSTTSIGNIRHSTRYSVSSRRGGACVE
jgi:hypothetical protein